jgi:hypothetical protein
MRRVHLRVGGLNHGSIHFLEDAILWVVPLCDVLRHGALEHLDVLHFWNTGVGIVPGTVMPQADSHEVVEATEGAEPPAPLHSIFRISHAATQVAAVSHVHSITAALQKHQCNWNFSMFMGPYTPFCTIGGGSIASARTRFWNWDVEAPTRRCHSRTLK